MEFTYDTRTENLRERLLTFMDEHVYPAEPVHAEQMRTAEPFTQPPIVEDLKTKARELGLWNLFLPRRHDAAGNGSGLTNLQYAPLAEISGRSPQIAPEAMNCSAPDTGNMEVLAVFGSAQQQDRWLKPLLDGEIRSAFGMTEPERASSDASNIGTRIERAGDHYVINGTKWWSSGAMSPRCKVFIVMGKTDPDGERHRQQSMILVPRDAPGVTIKRHTTVFGYADHYEGGHAEVGYDNVRVPAENLIGEEGSGFAIAQARLGPGRVHHCMRLVGMAERAFDLMCRRANERTPFGRPLAEQGVIREWVAEARIRIEQARLLVLKTAWLMDTVGNKGAMTEIQAIKVLVPSMTEWVVDKAIQVHGGGGVTQDFPLAELWAAARALRLADGPDEVHKMSLGKRELARLEDKDDGSDRARGDQHA